MVLACLGQTGENLTRPLPRRYFEVANGTVRERKTFTTRREDTEYIVCWEENLRFMSDRVLRNQSTGFENEKVETRSCHCGS